ncbi:Alpha/Beta hydrolase protein [Cyathus striatus]|nr:Alpha/Beta hydrolase protein [Cyathus striatus]
MLPLLTILIPLLGYIYLYPPSPLLNLSSPSTIDLGYIKYRGIAFTNVTEFRGIPYAEPPTGNLRFRAPLALNYTRVREEVDGDSTVVDVGEWAAPCVQGTMSGADEGGAGSEDCLKLNVVVPRGMRWGRKLPVLFYIHGGGYTFGNPASFPFTHWLSSSSQFITVSPAYRLSSFGFLSHPSVPQQDLNAGLQDLIMALKWVNEHIGKFGGDPGKVTIMGHSAGGSSVELLLVAKGVEGLFWAAVPQSVYRTPVPRVQDQVELFNFYATNAGCTRATFDAQMACLRKADVSLLAKAQDKAYIKGVTPPAYHIFRPVVDGRIITDYPTRLVMLGEGRGVPLLIGATTNETSSEGTDLRKELTKFFPALTKDKFEEIDSVYPENEHAPANVRFQTVTGEMEFRCSVSLFGDVYSQQGVPTWTYRFDEHDPMSDREGAGHAAENWFMFQGTENGSNGTTTFHTFTSSQSAFSEEVIAYLSSFIRVRDPNRYKLARSPTWPAYVTRTSDNHREPREGKEQVVFDGHEKEWRRARLVLRKSDDDVVDMSAVGVEEVGGREVERCLVVAAAVDDLQN